MRLTPQTGSFPGTIAVNFYLHCRLEGGFAPNPIQSLPLTSDPPHSRSSAIAALSGNECLWFSLRLWFSDDVCSSPNSWRIMNQSPVPGQWFSRSLALYRLPETWIDGCVTLTKILTLICLYYLKCTKFDQLIIRKIIKIVATRCQILRPKCTKFDFGWGFASDRAGGGLTALPKPRAGLDYF